MRFLADENLYVPIIIGLRERGHDVFSIVEQGELAVSDEEIF